MTDALAADLAAALAPDRVRTGAVELGLYGRDASVLAGEAAVACFPLDGDEVAAAVRGPGSPVVPSPWATPWSS